MVKDMWEDGWLILLLFVLMLLALPATVWVAYEESQRWDEFKVANNCRVVGKMSGDTFTTVGPNLGGSGGVSIGIGSTPGKTGWQCDDGMTYWR